MQYYVEHPENIQKIFLDTLARSGVLRTQSKYTESAEEWKRFYEIQRDYEDKELPAARRLHKGDALWQWGTDVLNQKNPELIQEGYHLIFLACIEDMLDYTIESARTAPAALFLKNSQQQYITKNMLDDAEKIFQKLIDTGKIPKYAEPHLDSEIQRVLGKPLESELNSEFNYLPNSNGKCPHCGHLVIFTTSNTNIRGTDYPTFLKTESGNDSVSIYSSKCPNCKCQKPIVAASINANGKIFFRLVHPFGINRMVPSCVPDFIKQDFLEASLVLSVSEKASAALSRRCLQNLLSNVGYTGRDLSEQIDNAMQKLPTRIAEDIDAIRQIGNFAAHPMKSQSTGTIADVETSEALWNLEVLEQLFDFCYVQPMIAQGRRKQLDAKLKALGKQPLKRP